MKIAIPYNKGQVNAHFGQSSEFIIYAIEDGKIADKKIINSQDLCHNHDGLAGLLKEEAVGVVITGGIGRPMIDALQSLGFKIVTGASGDAARVAENYAMGSLLTSNIDVCSCGSHN